MNLKAHLCWHPSLWGSLPGPNSSQLTNRTSLRSLERLWGNCGYLVVLPDLKLTLVRGLGSEHAGVRIPLAPPTLHHQV